MHLIVVFHWPIHNPVDVFHQIKYVQVHVEYEIDLNLIRVKVMICSNLVHVVHRQDADPHYVVSLFS